MEDRLVTIYYTSRKVDVTLMFALGRLGLQAVLSYWMVVLDTKKMLWALHHDGLEQTSVTQTRRLIQSRNKQTKKTI